VTTNEQLTLVIAQAAPHVIRAQSTRLCEMLAFYRAFLGGPAPAEETPDERRIRHAAQRVLDDLAETLVSLRDLFEVSAQISKAHAEKDQKEESDAR